MTGKHWAAMTADEQVPPWRWLVDELLLRGELDSWNEASESAGGDEGDS